MSRNRRRSAFGAGLASEVEPMVSNVIKADGTSAQNVLDAIAVGVTKFPALDTYYFLYEKHPIVSACVNMIAGTVSAGDYQVTTSGTKKALTTEEMAKDERVGQIREFFDHAFVDDTFRGAMYALAVDMNVFPLGYWRKKRAGKLLVGLERIDPRLVLPKANADRSAIDKFLVRKLQSDEQNINSLVGAPLWKDAEPVSPADIVFFKRSGGDKLLGAPSPLEHLDHTIGLDLAIRRFRQSFFGNGAVTGKIIAMKKASREQVRALENMIRNSKRGPENAYKTWVFSAGEDVVIADRGEKTGEHDIDFIKGSELNRDEVFMVYHVPPGKILFTGSALGSSGKAEDDATYQQDCVLPLEENIYEIITRDIIKAEFDITDLELAPTRRSMLRLDMFPSAEEGLQFGMTVNEARDVVNLPPSEKPGCDVPVVLGARGQGLLADEPADPDSNPNPEGGDELDDSVEGSKNQPNNKKPKPKPGAAKSAKGKARSQSWY